MPISDTVHWTSDNRLTGSGSSLSTYATSTSLKWYRISQLYKASSGFSLFGADGKCSIDDIGQGSVGNCWFFSAAATLAEKPGMMEKTFGSRDQFNNAAGFFDLKMYLLGVPITIRVDDMIPHWESY